MTALFGENVIETASGEPYDYAHPDVAVVHLKDIATALGNACRFAGQLKDFGLFCSVAEHAVLVSRILQAQGYQRAKQIDGLLHDGHESWVFDAPRPLKPTLGQAFEDVADRADAVVGERFGIDPARFHSDYVKLADDMALVHEGMLYMTHGPERWESRPDVPPLPAGLEHRGLEPRAAQWLFYDRAIELGLS